MYSQWLVDTGDKEAVGGIFHNTQCPTECLILVCHCHNSAEKRSFICMNAITVHENQGDEINLTFSKTKVQCKIYFAKCNQSDFKDLYNRFPAMPIKIFSAAWFFDCCDFFLTCVYGNKMSFKGK